jgi:GT2 family glycosyltransferase
LTSIENNFKTSKYEVIIVDNNSTDRSIENLEENFRAYNFYYRKINDGFGGGCNYGVTKADPDSKYVVFVNPDIIFIDDSLLKLYDFMMNHENVAVCLGLFINENNDFLYSYNYDLNLKWELMGSLNIGLNWFNKRLLSRKEIASNIPFAIDWGLGALLFVDKKAFLTVKGFDTDYFLYSEDNDLQYRLKKKGFQIYCIPSARFIHYYGSSLDDENFKTKYNYFFYQSKIIYLYKHFNIFKRNVIRLILIFGLLMRIFKAFLFKTHRQKIKKLLLPALMTIIKIYKVEPLS